MSETLTFGAAATIAFGAYLAGVATSVGIAILATRWLMGLSDAIDEASEPQ